LAPHLSISLDQKKEDKNVLVVHTQKLANPKIVVVKTTVIAVNVIKNRKNTHLV
jgi:hypothetical protein